MVSPDTIRTVMGIIGNMTGISFFLSPTITFYGIWKKGSVEQFSPVPYLASLLAVMLWVLYALPLVQPHNTLLLIISVFGCLVEFFYVLLFLAYSEGRKRSKVFIALLMEFVFVGIVAVLVLTLSHKHQQRSVIVGSLCVFFGSIMYGSPLAIMKMVIKTKSVEYMPFYLSLTAALNGSCWTIYALLRFDLFVTIQCSIGALLGFAQLVLYATYYKSTERQLQGRKNTEAGLSQVIVNGEPQN